MDNPRSSIRLNKFLAERLGVSRREADELIDAGIITINGKVAILGTRIDSKSKVLFNNKEVPQESDYTYLAFHKPVGYVCSRRAQGPTPTIYDLLPPQYHKLKTVGRLDKDSSGLILLTNDGDFAFQMTHPKFRKIKLYEVELDRPLEPLHQQMISDYGVMLDDGPSQFTVIKNDFAKPLLKGNHSRYEGAATSHVKTDVRNVPQKTVSRNQYIVTLSEGRNRQIRRTFAALGYHVTKLHRTVFGKYELSSMEPGQYAEIEK